MTLALLRLRLTSLLLIAATPVVAVVERHSSAGRERATT
jgi:hypothetical protein